MGSIEEAGQTMGMRGAWSSMDQVGEAKELRAEKLREIPANLSVLLSTVTGVENGIVALEKRLSPLMIAPPMQQVDEQKAPQDVMAPLAWEIEQASKRLLAASMRLSALAEAIEL